MRCLCFEGFRFRAACAVVAGCIFGAEVMKFVILNDRKPGHYKQSLGIVEQMPECQTAWLEIQFQAKWRDNLLRVFICLFGGVQLPTPLIHTLLRWTLIPESYNALLQRQTADIVLSTGSSVAAVNLLLGRMLGAKTVTCRRPSPVGTRYFDLAILPNESLGTTPHARTTFAEPSVSQTRFHQNRWMPNGSN